MYVEWCFSLVTNSEIEYKKKKSKRLIEKICSHKDQNDDVDDLHYEMK